MSLTDDDINYIETELKKTTVGYINKNWKTPPAGTHWANALSRLTSGLSPTPPTPTPTGFGNGIGTFREGDYQYAAALNALDVLMADINGSAAPAQIPNTRVLLYRSVCSVNKNYENSIPWTTASSNGWLLKDSSGSLIYNKGFSTNNIGDISNPAFSTALGNRVVQVANQYGYKGVWFDDGVAYGTSLINALPAGWSQANWYSNMVAHIGRVAKVVKAAGLEAVFNANGRIPGDSASDTGDNDIKFWTDIMATGGPTGLTHEYWMQNPVNDSQVVTLGTSWYQHWDGWRRLHPLCNSHGVDFMPLSYIPGGTTELTYLRACFLLDYDGGGSAFLLGNNDTNYPTFKALGSALGSAVESSPGVWVRHFQNGTATVNANNGTATIA